MNFKQNLPRHQYSCSHILLWISLVMNTATSMRCASRVIELLSGFFNLWVESPSWYTGRLWLMRLGYYKIYRAKEIAEDWIWIVDHSIQMGSEKCLIILGIRAKDLPANRSLTFNDVEPIDLVPVKHSNGDIVYEQLEEAIKKTGVPREIISDDGSDLKSGINKFIEQHSDTCRIYDIKHKTASLLKRLFEDDAKWPLFLKQSLVAKAQVQQTELAFLASPSQRSKARYMNIDTMISWGRDVLNFIDREIKDPSEKFNHEKIKEKLYWIMDFKDQINEWQNVLSIVETTESFVRHHGLFTGADKKLEIELNKVNALPAANLLRDDLLNFVKDESQKAKETEKLLGSSEVIESVFGKQKMLEKEQSKSGFTGLILSVGALVSTTTDDVVTKAMDTVKTNTVIRWADKNIGKSVQSFRKNFLHRGKNTEQKWDQLLLIT
jgi:hypothetical protein